MNRKVLCTAIVALAMVFPRPVIAAASCEDLRVVSGNNRFVPSTVAFTAKAVGTAQSYKFYFGDGTSQESTTPRVNHTFDVSGTFTARVDVGSSSCQTIFSLLESPLESQKSGCSNVFIQDGNNFPAGTDVKFLVTGYDNKSGIKKYKIDFGNGQVKEDVIGGFHLTFTTPGTYTIKGYITDSKNIEKGGTQACQAPLYITGAPIATQPATGTPTWFTAVGIFAAVVLIFMYGQKNYRHRRA